MHPLRTDDLLPLSDYLSRRREFYNAHRRYRDRYRRVRIGPQVALLFENRQTLWFRIQEFQRLARISEGAELQHHLDWFNLLLPQPQKLQAAFVLETDDDANWYREFDYWRDLTGTHVTMWLADDSVTAQLVTARSEDRTLGIAHWLEFSLNHAQQAVLADLDQAIRFEVNYKRYACSSTRLSDDVRQSLMDDLDMANRAA